MAREDEDESVVTREELIIHGTIVLFLSFVSMASSTSVLLYKARRKHKQIVPFMSIADLLAHLSISVGVIAYFTNLSTIPFLCHALSGVTQSLFLSSLFWSLAFALNVLDTIKQDQPEPDENRGKWTFFHFLCWLAPPLWISCFFIVDYFSFPSSHEWTNELRCLLFPNPNSWTRPLSLVIPYLFIVLFNARIYTKALETVSSTIRRGGVYTSRERKYQTNLRRRFVTSVACQFFIWIPSLLAFIISKIHTSGEVLFAFCLMKGVTVSLVGLINSLLYARLHELIKKTKDWCTFRVWRIQHNYEELHNNSNINS